MAFGKGLQLLPSFRIQTSETRPASSSPSVRCARLRPLIPSCLQAPIALEPSVLLPTEPTSAQYHLTASLETQASTSELQVEMQNDEIKESCFWVLHPVATAAESIRNFACVVSGFSLCLQSLLQYVRGLVKAMQLHWLMANALRSQRICDNVSRGHARKK